jgi:hypothetical protein
MNPQKGNTTIDSQTDPQEQLNNELSEILKRIDALQKDTQAIILNYLSQKPKEKYTRSMERTMDKVGYFAAWIWDAPHGKICAPDEFNNRYLNSMLFKIRRIFGIEDFPDQKRRKIRSIYRSEQYN